MGKGCNSAARQATGTGRGAVSFICGRCLRKEGRPAGAYPVAPPRRKGRVHCCRFRLALRGRPGGHAAGRLTAGGAGGRKPTRNRRFGPVTAEVSRTKGRGAACRVPLSIHSFLNMYGKQTIGYTRLLEARQAALHQLSPCFTPITNHPCRLVRLSTHYNSYQTEIQANYISPLPIAPRPSLIWRVRRNETL